MNNDPYKAFLKLLANSKDSQEIEAVFAALLTSKEQADIANRVRIFDLLDKEVTQREISQQLGVGIATVSRGARAMQQHDISALLNTYRD